LNARRNQIFNFLKQVWLYLKPYCRWLILGGTLFFLIKAFKDHWQEVAAIRIDGVGWATLAIALGITLLAHIWSGWVWTWILDELNQPVTDAQFVQVYLKTNIAKYLPGNVWHYYGRIAAAKTAGVPVGVATISVLLEPLLMAAAALMVALIGIQPTTLNITLQGLPLLGLAIVLLVVHPRFLNKVIRFVGKIKLKATNSSTADDKTFQLVRYPLRPLLGELGFIGLRGTGFLLTMVAFKPLELSQIPLLLGAFSLAWLLGLVVPGAPGGLGIFEATAIALLQQRFSGGLVITAIALYRIISILAEAAGAGLAWLDEQRFPSSSAGQ
jgi:glycosyltransferase 2 family protein